LNCSFTIDENEVMGDSIMNKTIVTNIKLVISSNNKR
jgi:hypothetical protein